MKLDIRTIALESSQGRQEKGREQEQFEFKRRRRESPRSRAGCSRKQPRQYVWANNQETMSENATEMQQHSGFDDIRHLRYLSRDFFSMDNVAVM